MRWRYAVTAGVLIATHAGRAWSGAEPSSAELQEARARFAEGRRLEEAGHFGEALVIFQRVARVKMTPQVRFHIALCHKHLGKPVEALANFRLAIQEAGDTAPNVVAEAKEHIATLEPKVAVVTVDFASSDPSFSITLDERAVNPGVPLDVEPGSHHVVLRKAGQTVDERWMTLGAGKRSRVELSPRAEAPSAPTNPTEQTNTSQSTNPPSHPSSGLQVGSIVAFSVAGAGVVGLATFALLRADRLAKLEAACPSFTGCDPGLEPVVQEGKTYATGVNAFVAVTGTATVAGIVLFAVAQRSTPRRGSKFVDVQVNPMVGLGGAFVTLEGRF